MPVPISSDEVLPTGTSHKRDLSEEASPGTPQDNRKRKGTSVRGVANLTPDQLAKKRANDREAQRAITERTKNQIDGLERKIRELTSQQPYQELQNMLRQKELVEAENTDIKKRLASVLSLIQPVLGQAGLEPQPYASPYASTRMVHSDRNTSTSPATAGHPQWQNPPLPMAHDPRAYAQEARPRQDMPHSLEMVPERQGLDMILDNNERGNKIPMSNGLPGIPPDPSTFPPSTRNAEVHSPAQQHQNHRSNSIPSIASTTYTNISPTLDHLTGYSTPIRNGPPTCPLVSILLDFLHERRQQALDDVTASTILGPSLPSFSVLLNPSLAPLSHPLSKVFTDIVATFPDISTLPEQVAVLYIMFLVMRWQISPTQENYERLPEWIMPRPSQLFTKHPAWIDHAPWPRMRDRLVNADWERRGYPFDNLFIPNTRTMSVNWPYDERECLVRTTGGENGEMRSDGLDDWTINPIFERHVRTLESWSLGPAFANAMPGFKDTFRVKEKDNREVA